MPQMHGEDNERLEQGNDQRRNDRPRHNSDEFTDHTADEQQRHERDDTRQHSRHYRPEHLAGTLEHRCEGFVTVLASGVYRFAHNNRIVNDDAQHHDQAEKADHVDRLPGHRHQPKGAANRDDQPQRHPETEPQLEKDPEHQKHQHQADCTVALQ